MKRFYRMYYDMERYENQLEKGIPCIYSNACNVGDIEIPKIKKGFFNNVIYRKDVDFVWPSVEFYYDSKESNIETDYLGNIIRWPIIKENVMNEIIESNISGVSFFPINLIDKRTNRINKNYYAMYIHNFIDAFDMKKSQYKYNPKYDFYTFVPVKTYLNVNSCSEYDIFRENRSVSTIFVSDKFKKMIENYHFTGFTFIEQK